LLFALALKVLTTELGVSIPDLKMNMWFLDDGHLVGKATDLVKCLEIIKLVGEPLGLYLNLPKCVVYGMNLDIFQREIARASRGLMVLGVSV
jgi:hypothetical protein